MVTDADRYAVRRRRADPPLVVRLALVWSHLLMVVAAARILASLGGWAPAWALARGPVGLGNLAIAGALLALIGLLTAIPSWRRSRSWRSLALLTLLTAHLLTVILFPPRWLLTHLQNTTRLAFFVETPHAEFALTIDDGIDPSTTPAILDVLARHDAHATFFVLGESLADHPDLARRCVEEGHELANHQMTDQPALTLPPDELEVRMRDADTAIRRLVEPRWFRPGGGWVTDRAKSVAHELDYRIALASVFPFDSHIRSSRFLEAYVTARTEAGDIVVLHDRGERAVRTAAALDRALPSLAERGLHAVTLSELASGRRAGR